MTMESESNIDAFTFSNQGQLSGTSVLEDLFFLGYTKSEKRTIYKDDKFVINVVYRTLTPIELRDIYESYGRFSTMGAQIIAEKIETLARAIYTINDMPLVLNQKDKDQFIKEYRHEPTPLEQARYILMEKLQSVHLLDTLYDEYIKFSESIKEHFEDIKKKLNQAG